MTVNFYRLQTHLCKEVEWFVHMYISWDLSFSPNLLQNVQQDQYNEHVRIKTIFVDFIVHCFPCMKQKS
jgi:hypothetical protein